jgi:hypothetical protein
VACPCGCVLLICGDIIPAVWNSNTVPPFRSPSLFTTITDDSYRLINMSDLSYSKAGWKLPWTQPLSKIPALGALPIETNQGTNAETLPVTIMSKTLKVLTLACLPLSIASNLICNEYTAVRLSCKSTSRLPLPPSLCFKAYQESVEVLKRGSHRLDGGDADFERTLKGISSQ